MRWVGAASWAGVEGFSEISGCPIPQRLPTGTAAPRAHSWRLRGAEPTPAEHTHTPGEHAQCGPGNFLPSRQPPRPSPPGPSAARKVGGWELRGLWGELHVPLGAPQHPHPQSRPLPCICPAPSAAPRGRLHRWARGRGCHLWWPEALAARLSAWWPHWQCAAGSGGESPAGRAGWWKGVCEPWDVCEHTLPAVTQSPGFFATVKRGKGWRLPCSASFGAPTGCWVSQGCGNRAMYVWVSRGAGVEVWVLVS